MSNHCYSTVSFSLAPSMILFRIQASPALSHPHVPPAVSSNGEEGRQQERRTSRDSRIRRRAVFLRPHCMLTSQSKMVKSVLSRCSRGWAWKTSRKFAFLTNLSGDSVSSWSRTTIWKSLYLSVNYHFMSLEEIHIDFWVMVPWLLNLLVWCYGEMVEGIHNS
jgi:hypothetical protein